MTLAQAGVREAFALLVARHAEHLVRVCSMFVHDSAAGAELAQETWAAAWSERAYYRADGKFIVWLLSAARNRCRNHLRHQRVRLTYALGEAARSLEPVSPDQIERLLVEERRRRVCDALSRLPESMREALLLRYAEELNYDEMAVVLQTGESTLRSRVHHGLRLLRDLLEKTR